MKHYTLFLEGSLAENVFQNTSCKEKIWTKRPNSKRIRIIVDSEKEANDIIRECYIYLQALNLSFDFKCSSRGIFMPLFSIYKI